MRTLPLLFTTLCVAGCVASSTEPGERAAAASQSSTCELALESTELPASWQPAADAYVADCAGGFQWCSFDSFESFALPACAASIDDVVTATLGAEALRLRGVAMDRDGLTRTPLFGASYSDGGPGLLAAIEAEIPGPVVGWRVFEEGRCHNCSAFEDTYVLWFTEAARVVVAYAGHGYDS
jgi:hypothetical protein